jgi:hypothetical protein
MTHRWHGMKKEKSRRFGRYTRYLVSDLPTGACAEEEALTGSSLSSGRTATWKCAVEVSTPSLGRPDQEICTANDEVDDVY